MAVDPEVSRILMQEEISLAEDFARLHKWIITPNYPELKFQVKMNSHKGELYIVEVTCENYKEHPPFFEFIDPGTGARGTPQAYPKTHDSFFHPSGPCICAPFNRKAYKSVVSTGPHSDWQLSGWMDRRDSNVNWGNFSKLGDMLGLIQTRIGRPEFYKGRMG